jgi:hypothetical protein
MASCLHTVHRVPAKNNGEGEFSYTIPEAMQQFPHYKIMDLTHDFSEDMPVWPGSQGLQIPGNQ